MKNKGNYRKVLIIDCGKPRLTLGRKVILPKYPESVFFIHKYKGEYRLSEARSGSMVISGDKRNKELILKAQERFDSVIPQRYKNITEMVDTHLKMNNIEPILSNLEVLNQ